MDLKTSVYCAAAEGNLIRLKACLHGMSSSEIKDVISSLTNGTTPLVIACRNGNFDVVRYLILDCHVDINQVGAVNFTGETVHGAPALWCAAAAGKIRIVKLLVSQGANVNCTTELNSTPLRAACFDGHFNIVVYLIQQGADIEIANKHGHTSLMIACYQSQASIVKYLLDRGADVNKKTVKGSTALHDCAESGSLTILKLLLNHGAHFEADLFGTTPMMSAAISGNSAIVEYFIQYFNCSKLDKINALELLGATDIDLRRNINLGLKCWRRAMNMRYENPKSPLLKSSSESPFSKYIQSSEVKSLAELEEIKSDPDEVRMQALLVRERVLGATHPQTINYLRLRGAVYGNGGNFETCFKLWTYALDMQQKSLDPIGPLMQSILMSFSESFSSMIFDHGPERDVLVVSFGYILYALEKGLEILDSMQTSSVQNTDTEQHFQRILSIIMHIVELMCRLLPFLDEPEVLRLKQTVYTFVHMHPKGKNNSSPLHLACSQEPCLAVSHHTCRFPSLCVVELLLEVGACPNVLDLDLNTPLHLVSMMQPCPISFFATLLNHGAHLDVGNKQRKTPLESIQNIPNLFPLRYINLQCLCARAVRLCNMSYEGLVHKSLERFVDAH